MKTTMTHQPQFTQKPELGISTFPGGAEQQRKQKLRKEEAPKKEPRKKLSKPGDPAATLKETLAQMEKDLKRAARKQKDKDKKLLACPSILLILSCVMLCQFFVGAMSKLNGWSPAECSVECKQCNKP